MFYKKNGFPDEGESVIATVKRILPHCAFVNLDEYKDKEAMLHISEISSSWTKNIRNHVQEGDLLVLKVMKVDKKKGHIDTSLKRVSDGERKNKLLEWKIEKRMERLLEVFGKNNGKTLEEIYKIIGEKIVTIFGSLSNFYNAIKEEGEKVLEDLDVEEKWKEGFFKIVNAQIKKTRITIKKSLKAVSYANNGIVKIKKILQNLPKIDNIDMDISYVSSPKYLVTIKANSYKEGKNGFDKLWNMLKKNANKNGVILEIENE